MRGCLRTDATLFLVAHCTNRTFMEPSHSDIIKQERRLWDELVRRERALVDAIVKERRRRDDAQAGQYLMAESERGDVCVIAKSPFSSSWPELVNAVTVAQAACCE
jgi:hypothetical protein